MSRDANPSVDGTVIGQEKTHFVVQLDDENKTQVKCRLSGKMRQHMIRIVIGDRVQIRVGAYDLSQGFITYRYK